VRTLTRLARWLAVLLVAILATSACALANSADNKKIEDVTRADDSDVFQSIGSTRADKQIEEVIRAYYQAVGRDDVDTQASFWVLSRQNEAIKQAQAWTKRSKDGLQPSSFHVESTQERLKEVHYSLVVKDRKIPEEKAALMEYVNGVWRFRELR